jgi:hypothetical protein
MALLQFGEQGLQKHFRVEQNKHSVGDNGFSSGVDRIGAGPTSNRDAEFHFPAIDIVSASGLQQSPVLIRDRAQGTKILEPCGSLQVPRRVIDNDNHIDIGIWPRRASRMRSNHRDRNDVRLLSRPRLQNIDKRVNGVMHKERNSSCAPHVSTLFLCGSANPCWVSAFPLSSS